MDLSTMRHRSGGHTARRLTYVGHEWTLDGVSPTMVTYTPLVESYDKNMYDVVIKDFKKRSARGEIFNNPKQTVETKFLASGHYKGVSVHTDRNGVVERKTVDKPLVDSINAIQTRRTLYVEDYAPRLKNLAITSAYAGVTANEQNAVLWFGEFRETIKMATDIGAGLLALYKRTAKQRAEWAKGKLTIPEAQSLTLAILYGLVPLEQSITQVMEGLFKLKPNGRATSRGFQVGTATNSFGVQERADWRKGIYADVNETVHESLKIEVRAGVLYDIDLDKFPSVAIVADPKQVAETAYALTRLSFVTDWFINVGNTIRAWSPSVGTVELAAWVTVKSTYSQHRSHVTYQPGYTADNGTIFSGISPLERVSSYDETIVTRTPVDRSDLAIFPRVSVNLNTDKLFALVLLFAKVKQK